MTKIERSNAKYVPESDKARRMIQIAAKFSNIFKIRIISYYSDYSPI